MMWALCVLAAGLRFFVGIGMSDYTTAQEYPARAWTRVMLGMLSQAPMKSA